MMIMMIVIIITINISITKSCNNINVHYNDYNNDARYDYYDNNNSKNDHIDGDNGINHIKEQRRNFYTIFYLEF